MKCNFSILIVSPIDDTITKISAEIKNRKGDIIKTKDGWTFSIPSPLGVIEGDVTINDGIANISITDKPFLVSCNTIKSRLIEYLNVQS